MTLINQARRSLLVGAVCTALLCAFPPLPSWADAVMTTATVRQSETEVGNLLADAVRIAAGADFAFVPAAAFKTEASAPKPATSDQASSLLVLDDPIVVLSLRGAQILEALERSVTFAPQPSAGFLHISGLKFTYDLSKPSGNRVVSATVNGMALEAVKTYKVATTRPLANGQQGYLKIWDRDQITGDPGKTLTGALTELAKARDGKLSANKEGRIVVTGEKPKE